MDSKGYILCIFFLNVRMIEAVQGHLKPLILLDSLLLPLLVYICPENDLCKLFALIPADVSTSWIRHTIDPGTERRKKISPVLVRV